MARTKIALIGGGMIGGAGLSHVIGWTNLSVKNGKLVSDIGYVSGSPPKERGFNTELEAELARIQEFLGL